MPEQTAAKSDHWSVEPKNLIAHHNKVKGARVAQIREGTTYAAMYHARPSMLNEAAGGLKVYDQRGIKELGFNTLAECFQGGLSQVARPLKAKVTDVSTDWKVGRATRGLAPVIDAIMEGAKFRKKAARMVETSLAWAEGHAVWEDDALSGARVCWNLDPSETFIASTRDEATTVRPRARRWLKAWAAKGEKKAEIEYAIDKLPDYKPDDITGVDAPGAFSAEDNVAVYEAWLTPLGPDAPGRHVIQLADDFVLVDEPWTIPMLPLVSYRWREGMRGPSDGQPLGRTLAPLQAIETAMHRKKDDAVAGQVPHVENSDDGRQPFSDSPYSVLKANKDKTYPKVVYPPGGPPEITDYIQDIRETAHRATGISEETAEGTVPANLESGIGIANYVAVINQRLSQPHAEYHDTWTDSARINVALGPPKGSGDNKLSAQVDWDLLKLPQSAYTVAFQVVNAAVQEIAFRIDLLFQMHKLGKIDTGELLARIEDANINAVESRLNAERDFIEFQIGRALDDAVIESPVPFQDPTKLAKSAAEAWMRARSGKVKPPRAEMDALFRLQQLAAGPGPKTDVPVPGGALPPVAGGGTLPPAGGTGIEPVATLGSTAPLSSQLPPLATPGVGA
jgi:hypothetical protein